MILKIFLLLLISYQPIRAQMSLPLIQTESFSVQPLENQRYQLSLTLPNSQRMEVISLDPKDSTLIIEGSISTFYPETSQNLIINYVADKNGYRASFKFSSLQPPASGVAITTRLSGSDLKSLAG